MRIENPFRIGIDGDARVVAEKYARLKRYLRRFPKVASLLVSRGSVRVSRRRAPRRDRLKTHAA